MRLSRSSKASFAVFGFSLGLLILVSGCSRTPADKLKHSDSTGDIDGLAELEKDYEDFVDTPETGRYQLHVNVISEGARDHFLLDTATGDVWMGFIPLAAKGQSQASIPVAKWIKVSVAPPPAVDFPDVGRFSLTASYNYGADKFLVDSAMGRIWCRLVDGDNFVFHETPVQRPSTPESPGTPVSVEKQQ